HNIEHELSAFYDIPHAAGLAIITPRWMDVVKDQKAKKLVQYGKRVWNLEGTEGEIIKQSIQITFDFFRGLGVKMNLKDWDIDDKNFPIIIERLTNKAIGEIPLSRTQITEILNNCLL
ncbi:MAG: iron-containing alcohol dehydrogenase, partial [bacterium]